MNELAKQNMDSPSPSSTPPTSSKIGFWISGILLFLYIFKSCIYVVDQRQFGVIYSVGKGQIQDVVNEPGLYFKLPSPLQSVDFIDKRLRVLDSSGTDTIQTIEKQNVVVDWFVRWRITDPASYIRNVGSDENSREIRLTQVVRNAFQEEINKRTVKDMLSSKREELMNAVRAEVIKDVQGTLGDAKGRSWGIDITDVRLTRMDFPKDITDSVYRRMEAERTRVANELRSTGAADGEQIRANADKQGEIIVAEAYREAQRTKGEGDAKASGLYAESFGKDSQFASFFRSLEAYKSSFNSKSDVLVVDPAGSDFFRAMRNSK